MPATQKKEVRIQNSGVRMETGNSKNRGTVAVADNQMEGCAPSQPFFDPGHDPAVAGLRPSINATT